MQPNKRTFIEVFQTPRDVIDEEYEWALRNAWELENEIIKEEGLEPETEFFEFKTSAECYASQFGQPSNETREKEVTNDTRYAHVMANKSKMTNKAKIITKNITKNKKKNKIQQKQNNEKQTQN